MISGIPSTCLLFEQEAALYVNEGEDNDKFIHHPMGKWSKMAYTILHNPVFYVADLLVSILLMALALMEKPTFFEDAGEENSTMLNVRQVIVYIASSPGSQT